jgi:hypothetical protein
MALPILDGNQTAATLSTIVTGGQHIPAHTVVSLGSQAITDMRSAVSGSVVSISNFPSTQTIAGTVTAKIDGIDPTVIGNGGSIIQSIPGPDVNSIRTVLWSVDTNYDIGAEVGPSNPLPISGTVTANAFGFDSPNSVYAPIPLNDGATAVNVAYHAAEAFPVSGTVTIGGFSTVSVGGTIGGLVISGRRSGLAENILLDSSTGHLQAIPQVPNGMGGYANVSDALPLPVKGSVTIGANPSGTLTTRFGSVTTASVAQLTSCVTNTSRKYLLAQNISAGTVTIGIGFSPTTTQGIQLPAGGGLTFDAFCPTGAVYWLGAVTGAAFTILEG